ncbi:hypothetical protein CQW23_12772 [Capsicum baccatum]|uniref:Uncharacterized protein n=1 Tax=Capsicum baccatum TaxID=33114 RepID=A0A2G2WTJ7_CAPBA|nr:hypothetical protein CQW23_12772 [Capsicum baccatum]
MGSPDLLILRSILPKFLGIKGHCLVGLLAQRQLLIRMDQYDDFVAALSRVRKSISVDKATQVRSKPRTTMIKVILDVMDKHLDRIRLQMLQNEDDVTMEIEGASVEKLQGDACDYQNIKKKQQNKIKMGDIPVGQALARVSENLLERAQAENKALQNLPSDVDTSAGTKSLIISKQDMELNNTRDDVGDEGWTVVLRKQSVSPQIIKEHNVAKKHVLQQRMLWILTPLRLF